MGFGVGAYAKIKSVEVSQNYTKCKLVISKKDKLTGKYFCSFTGIATFVGNAHNQKPMEGQKIKITSCTVTNGYLQNGEQKFGNFPNYAVFGYELQAETHTVSTSVEFQPIDDDEELPF